MIYWLLNMSTGEILAYLQDTKSICHTELNAAVFLLEHMYATFIILMREQTILGALVG